MILFEENQSKVFLMPKSFLNTRLRKNIIKSLDVSKRFSFSKLTEQTQNEVTSLEVARKWAKGILNWAR